MLTRTTKSALALHRGFSLLEVMVAVVVICIGLLGIAKMQALSLSNMNMSRQRSLAAMEAASFASAMHSNRQYWASFAADFSVQISGTPGTVVSTDAVLQGQTAADLGALNACVGTANGLPVCNVPLNLAANDLARWWVNSVSVQLPNPIATVACPASPVGNPAPVACTVTISWTEKAVAINRDEATAEAAGSSSNERPVFILYVEP
jgi:type IV pilus assembly protein PilV